MFDEQEDKVLFDRANLLKSEYVIRASGIVRKRENPNPNIPTGYYEVLVRDMEVLNESAPLPIQIIKQTEDSEEIRLKYRYLDLRRERMKNNIIMRNRINFEIRRFLNERGFIDIETPFLTKSTPEGARDFLVPSRINPGRFYALPQSPQIFKQLLMVAGFEKYFQIVKCFRDEDLRADRQPEFTQLDIEMSFVDENDIYELIDNLFFSILKNVYNIEITIPIPRMKYDEAMSRFGSDRPDLRFGMELNDITEIVKKFEPKNFIAEEIENGDVVYALVSPLSEKITRKYLDNLTIRAKDAGCRLFSWGKVQNGGISGPFKKLFGRDRIQSDIASDNQAIIYSCMGELRKVQSFLGEIRLEIGKILDLVPKDRLNFIWITDFPLFEWSEDENKIVSVHHPFTSPKGDILSVEGDDVYRIKSRSYDLVLNGVELGGGSIRIHRADVQEKVFSILGLKKEEIDEKFGFLLEAFKYGAPPHGGIAFGLDRMVMMFQGEDSIREVIPFPKTASGICPLTGAPDEVSNRQLDELGIKLKNN